MVRTLVVDDELPARRRLAHLLAELGASVVGTAGSADEALRLLDRVPVDAAFLDIRLPEVDGLALGDRLRRRGVPVVFVTAFADFALPAFDLGALDYLLKPVSRDRLGRALARITARTTAPRSVARLCLRDGRDRRLLPVPGLLYLRRDAGITTVTLDQETLHVREALHRLETVLAPYGFFRCHRAYLVNLQRVRRIVPWSRDAQSLLLDDPKETIIPLAKSRIQELRFLLLWP